jgi:hypothetical protein
MADDEGDPSAGFKPGGRLLTDSDPATINPKAPVVDFSWLGVGITTTFGQAIQSKHLQPVEIWKDDLCS